MAFHSCNHSRCTDDAQFYHPMELVWYCAKHFAQHMTSETPDPTKNSFNAKVHMTYDTYTLRQSVPGAAAGTVFRQYRTSLSYCYVPRPTAEQLAKGINTILFPAFAKSHVENNVDWFEKSTLDVTAVS